MWSLAKIFWEIPNLENENDEQRIAGCRVGSRNGADAKLLERVPSDKGPWKPHAKSMALGHLALLVATMPGWLTKMAQGVDIDLAAAGGYSFQKTEALLEQFDSLVREAREALGASRNPTIRCLGSSRWVRRCF